MLACAASRMPKPALPRAMEGVPSDAVLEKLRIPFVQGASLVRGEEHQRVFLLDLGLSGAFAEISEPLAVGATARLTFPLPGNDIPLVVGCRVAWRHARDERPTHLPEGAGLEFVEISPADHARLRRHLVEHCRSTRGARRFVRPWSADGSD
jgi:hypothetical protein